MGGTPVSPTFDQVTTGYANHVESAHGLRAFGGISLKIFLESDNQGYLTAMWLDHSVLREDQIEPITQLLSNLPHGRELLFVDWVWSRLFEASNMNAWRRYLSDYSRPTPN